MVWKEWSSGAVEQKHITVIIHILYVCIIYEY